MVNSTSAVKLSCLHQEGNKSSKAKVLAFALLIILGIGGLAGAGIGASGLFHAGALSSLGQVNSIVMIVIGGGGGIPFLAIGIIGFVRWHPCSQSKVDTSIQADLNSKSEKKERVQTVTEQQQGSKTEGEKRAQDQEEKRVQAQNSTDEQFLSPYLIREGVYGMKFKKNNETLFLRMELLTEENKNYWANFREMNEWVANSNNGLLSGLVKFAGRSGYPDCNEVQDRTGFTQEEYAAFTETAIAKKKIKENLGEILAINSVGSGHLSTNVGSGGKANYIVYVSNREDFSIQDAHVHMTGHPKTLKTYIEAYKHILISVGSSFSEGNSIENRGISRNPHWVFEEKYAGLSMILHGFSCAVAEKYFPEKTIMQVKPVGSMQCIIKKNLLPGDGYIMREGEKIDITDLNVSPDDIEHLDGMNYIKMSAMTRIFKQEKA